MNVELDIYEATIAKLPWGDSEKWTPGEWYPMPLGFMERDEPDWIVAGYGDLRSIKEDFFKRLTIARTEAVGLYDHLMRGKINGLVYEGECACFVGTIANLRKEDYLNLSIDLKVDASSATERWFLGIRQGDTPDNNPVSKITSEWLEEFLNSNNIVVPKYKLISSLDKPDLFGG